MKNPLTCLTSDFNAQSGISQHKAIVINFCHRFNRDSKTRAVKGQYGGCYFVDNKSYGFGALNKILKKLSSSPIDELGKGALEMVEPRYEPPAEHVHVGTHGNPESSNHQAPSH